MISGSPGFLIRSPVQKSGIRFWQCFKQILQVDSRKERKRKAKHCPRIWEKYTENCPVITDHSLTDGLPEGNVNKKEGKSMRDCLN